MKLIIVSWCKQTFTVLSREVVLDEETLTPRGSILKSKSNVKRKRKGNTSARGNSSGAASTVEAMAPISPRSRRSPANAEPSKGFDDYSFSESDDKADVKEEEAEAEKGSRIQVRYCDIICPFTH